jgi:hypothetical protein
MFAHLQLYRAVAIQVVSPCEGATAPERRDFREVNSSTAAGAERDIARSQLSLRLSF